MIDALTEPKLSDANDLARTEGPEAVKKIISDAQHPPESDEETLTRLAKLSLIEYDRLRESEAKRLGIKAGTLDGEVAKRRPRKTHDGLNGQALSISDVEPFAEPVDGAELFDEIETTISRYITASPEIITTAALFVVHTYAYDLGDISPFFFITGPTKRCGKSRLLSVMKRMVNRPLITSSASAAALYRAIEILKPSLCLDEVDCFVQGDDDLRGILNSGHTRDAAYHLGCKKVGEDFEPCRWSTWAPKIMSGIGRLAGTLEDRAFIIQMRRRKKDERNERWRDAIRFDDLRSKCARFVADHADEIRNANPPLPDTLNDRACDNWTPLLVLADCAGGKWPESARRAALRISGGDADMDVDADYSEQLIADIHAAFKADNLLKLSSKDLCQKLAEMDGRPWAEFGRNQKPMSQNQLAKLLQSHRITSHNLRLADGVLKGYELKDFEDVFSRYVPNFVFQNATPLQPAPALAQTPVSEPLQPGFVAPCENAVSTNGTSTCSGCSASETENGVEERI